MSWYILALFPPVLWSLGNVVDQFLAREIFKRSAFSFLIISCLFTLPVAVGMGIIFPQVFALPLPIIGMLVVSGCIGMAGAWPYIIAIRDDGAENTMTVLQTVPVFVYLFGLVFLGESLETSKLLGAAIIVAGALLFTWNPLTKRARLRSVLLMLVSAMIWAGYAVWIRHWVLQVEWVAVTFWAYCTWTVIGLVGTLCARDIRIDLKDVVKSPRAGIFLAALLIQQLAACSADLIQAKALSIAPTGVQVILFGGMQPVIILLLCGMLHKVWPQSFDVLQLNRGFALRIACVAFMIFGLSMLI